MVLGRKYASDESELLTEKRDSHWLHQWKPYASTLAFVVVLSVSNYCLIPYVGYRATGFGFLVGVLPIAVAYGLAPALLFAALSALIWDYFFIPPRFTFSIQTSEDVMMNLTYFVVASVSGFSGSRIREHERALKAREQQAKLLYRIEKGLADKDSLATGLEEATGILKVEFGIESVILYSNDAQLRSSESPSGFRLSEEELEQAKWTHRNEKRAGSGTSTFSGSRFSFYPLRGNENVTGVLVVGSDLTKHSRAEPILRDLCTVIGVAIEREVHRATSRRIVLLEESEKLHQTLLNSVSHELRTPLTTILGTANHLVTEPLPPEALSSVQELQSSAERLNQTVTNLLDMSRISSGALLLNRSVIDLPDFVRTCVARAEHSLSKHRVKIQDPKESLYIRGDERVLETAFANLLNNAARYSPEGTEIRIAIRAQERDARVEITNQGKGIPAGDEEAVFDKFYSNSGETGLGLGLAIVREIIELHSGAVVAKSGSEATTFTVQVPREELPDRLKEELRSL